MRLLVAVLFAAMAWNINPASAQTYTHPTTGQQNTNIGSCIVTTCSGIYVDDGGPGGTYSMNVNSIERTFCTGNADEQIRATFSSFSMNDTYFLCSGPNSCCDYLTIYDGPNSSSPVLFSDCRNSPGTVTSTSGCLTFKFVSDFSIQLAGWNATLSCVSGSGGPQGNTNSDCAYATPVCGSVSLNDPSAGPGIVAEGCADCMLGENYANWYKIGVSANGTLAFTINPNQNSDNFDFALYGPNTTCGALGTPVRCSAAAAAGDGNTGMGNGAVDNSEDVTGDQWVAPLNVTAGQTYLLLLNGNSAAMGSNGFALNFTGTADVTPASLSASISGTTTLTFGASTTISFSGTPNATITYKVNNGPNQTIVLNGAGTATLNTGPLTVTTTYSLVGVALVAGCSKSVSGSAVVAVCDGIIYVDADATGANNGTSWTDALTNLQDALTLACGTAEIWVAEGTYKPTSGVDRTISFMMKNGVGVYGGFDGMETMRDQRDWKTNSTILSGEIGAPGLSGNSYHVVFFDHASASTVLDGFTITQGNGEMTQNGGGIYNDGSGVGRQSNPRIANCTITGNVARNGGGLFNDGYRGNGSPEVVNCVFSGNKATLDGGAAYNFGGNNGNSSPLFTNVIFTGNKAERIGGGVFNDAVDATGGTCNPVFKNCSFSGNQADFGVGGMYNDAFTGTCSPILTNCILWGNAGQIDNRNGTPTVRFSIVQGGYTPCTDCPGGDGNLGPLFVSQPPISLGTSGDLHLEVCSQAVDAGTAAGAPATDLDGNARQDVLPGGGIVDIGAYEFQSNLGAGTVIWTGATDTDWSNPCNWDGYAVPGATGDVLIPDVTNDPVVMASTAAVAQSVHVQPNAALTIAAMGSLSLEGDTGFPSGGMYNQGTVTNNGALLIGQNISPGMYGIVNEATLENNADAEIRIDRPSNMGIWNSTAAASLTNAGTIVVCETAGSISVGLRNEGDVQNTDGEIRIDRFNGAGIHSFANSTFSNSGKIIVGKLNTGFGPGIYNFGHVENLPAGEIELDRASSGIYNTTSNSINSSFTNEGKIVVGQTASLNGPGIYNYTFSGGSASFENKAGGEILLDRTSAGIHNDNNCSFDNSGLIKVATTALGTGFNPAIYNRSTFNNNAGGEIRVDSINRTGLHHQSGTFTNGGKIILGISLTNPDFYPGVYNEAAFINQTDAELHIDRFPHVGFQSTSNASLTNSGLIRIGEKVTGGRNGLFNNGTIDNQATGEIYVDHMDGTNNSNGVYHSSGTFGNAGKVIIGSIAGAGATGLFNQSTFNNSGEISVDSVNGTSTRHGLFNSSGTFTNTGKITLGSVDSVGNWGLYNNATFHNNASGEISIDRCKITGLRNGTFSSATFNNHGTLAIGANSGVGSWGIWNDGNFTNSSDLSIDNTSVTALRHQSNTFTNTGSIALGGIANIGDWGLWNQSAFINSASGNIHIDRTSNTGLLIFSNTFTNTGTVTIGAETAVGDQAIYNQGTLANGTCAQLYIFAPLHNVSTLTNFGLFQVNALALHTNTGFTNNGIIAYPQGNPIPNVTNNEIIIAPTTVNGCEVISPALTLGSPVDLTILGVFTDAAATISAGTYVVATNTFTPTSVLDEGTHDFFVKIEDVVDGCTRIVPWQLTTQNCCDAPEAICQVYTAVLGPGGTASVIPANVDNGSTADCGLQSMTVSPNQFDCSNLGPQTVTLTVTDINNDSNQCMATVTVVDNSLPGITCPGPAAVSCSGDVPAVNLAAVSATDNCGTPTKSHVGDATSNQTCTNRKTVTRTYRANDGTGNSTTCAQVITVYDGTLPTFTFTPANVTVQCNSVPAVGTPTASDGCGGSVSIAYNGQTVTNVLCMDKYTLTRKWTVTDACGNTQTATQRIVVTDTQLPNFTGIPANITVQCTAIPNPATPTATDNCDTDVAITYNGQTTTAGACPNAYTLTRRWTAADNCGNTRSISQRITVVDNVKPLFTAFPGNTTIACDETPPALGAPTASDGCGPATVTYLGQSTTSGSCPGSYQIKRIWRATDACGNSTAATQTIQVSDTGVPVFTSTPSPLTIECG
ncbi:MAG: choice-of-anchor Q domain-containing protein, partial [Saprospiraceae bacterium]